MWLAETKSYCSAVRKCSNVSNRLDDAEQIHGQNVATPSKSAFLLHHVAILRRVYVCVSVWQSSGISISLVFVEVAGSCSSSHDTLSAPDLFLAWERLQRLRDDTKDGVFVLVSSGSERQKGQHFALASTWRLSCHRNCTFAHTPSVGILDPWFFEGCAYLCTHPRH